MSSTTRTNDPHFHLRKHERLFCYLTLLAQRETTQQEASQTTKEESTRQETAFSS